MDYSTGANVYEYLEEESNEDVLCFINKLQALKRKRKLTFAEQEKIIELREVHKKVRH